MFFFSFALVPLYDVFCEITGLNGKSHNLRKMHHMKQKLVEI